MMKPTTKPRFIAFDELKPLYGETRSRTQIRRAIEDGLYPAPKQLSGQRIGWETRSLDEHYNARPTVIYGRKGKRVA
jgi:hypothetical protein